MPSPLVADPAPATPLPGKTRPRYSVPISGIFIFIFEDNILFGNISALVIFQFS